MTAPSVRQHISGHGLVGVNAAVSLGVAPIKGNTLLLAVTARNAAGGEHIPTPAGWTAAVPEFQNQQGGFPTLVNWMGRLFFKPAAGAADQNLTGPSTGFQTEIVCYAELDRPVLFAASTALTGWHVHGPAATMLYGDLAADGYPTVGIGDGLEAIIVGAWGVTDSNTLYSVDQVGGQIVEAHQVGADSTCALAVLPIAPTAGSYRLTGQSTGNDNFPFWGMAMFGPSGQPMIPGTPGGGMLG